MSAVRRFAEDHRRAFAHVDWYLLLAALSISLLGLLTMHSFSEEQFFDRQIVWIGVALCVFFIASLPEYQFLRRTPLVIAVYGGIIFLLGLVFLFGSVVKGAQERFNLGLFFVQPSDPAKLTLVILLAKYFTRRHIEIAHLKHILISGAYAFALFTLVFLQPDLGSAIIISAIWFGMVLAAGISLRHLGALFLVAALICGTAWHWGLRPYQKDRVLTFLHPLADVQGAGYNAYQSTVAVGSGELLGKGVGYGTQSKLQFLPEYQTDFIFAAYAEEWGFLGVLLLLGLFTTLMLRILGHALRGSDNFHTFVALGIAMYFLAQFTVHVGMNIGLLPITGTTLPFMSYGGSHLITEYLALGMLMGMRRRPHASMRTRNETELIGAI